MKAILISDHAKWCALMMNGDKTIEVRKSTALYKAIQKLIDEYGYAEFYVYCTKDEKQGLVWDDNGKGLVNPKLFPYSKGSPEHNRLVNGKVIFKFRCHKVEDILFDITCITNDLDKLYTITNDENKLLEISCLTKKQISSYLKLDGCFPHLSSSNKGYFSSGFAIHISDLEIFDKPKELSEFKICCKRKFCNCFEIKCMNCSHLVYEDENLCDKRLTKAPQSWCYVEV